MYIEKKKKEYNRCLELESILWFRMKGKEYAPKIIKLKITHISTQIMMTTKMVLFQQLVMHYSPAIMEWNKLIMQAYDVISYLDEVYRCVGFG